MYSVGPEICPAVFEIRRAETFDQLQSLIKHNTSFRVVLNVQQKAFHDLQRLFNRMDN